jgi:hypothetical protein
MLNEYKPMHGLRYFTETIIAVNDMERSWIFKTMHILYERGAGYRSGKSEHPDHSGLKIFKTMKSQDVSLVFFDSNMKEVAS